MRSSRHAGWIVAFGLVCGAAATAAEGVYQLVPQPNGVQVNDPQGKPVFGYLTSKPAGCELTANSVCCFHPVYTPAGEVVTALAPKDHLHHRGIFLAWYSMQGTPSADFWGWGKYAPTEGRTIVHRDAQLVAADAERAEVQIHNDWMAEQQPMLREELTVVASRPTGANVLDLSYRLTPTQDLRLDQTAYGGLCVAGRRGTNATIWAPQGEVTLASSHYLKPETNWPDQPWYALSVGGTEGTPIGVAVLPHPSNPPATWHNPAAICMLNPCVTAPAPLELKKDQPWVLRYRIVAYDGRTPTVLLDRLAEEWRRR